MAASTTDLISKVTSASYAAPARVQTARSSGVTTLLCDALTGWDTTTLQFFVTYRLDGAGKVIAGSEVAWTGIVSGNSITTMVATAGTDAGNQVGDIVVAMPTHEWAKRLAQAILVSHNRDGTLKDGIVATANISNAAVTTAKQTTQTWSLGETNGIALNTNYQAVASQTLPAVTQAHKYLITSCFAVANAGATTNLTYAAYVSEGANGIGYVFGDMPSGSYTLPAFNQTSIFTSSASGGQTIVFGLKNVTATSGQSSSAGSFTIVDLGCA